MKIFLEKINNKKDKGFTRKATTDGFALLFAVMISSIVLAVGLGVANIAYKEITFSASATAANDAFSAADTGVECALYWDKGTSEFPTGFFGVDNGDGPARECSETQLDLSDTGGQWIFHLVRLGTDEKSCAVVTVTKTYAPNQTHIVSKGYSLGGNNNLVCFSSSQNRVERQLEVTY